MKTFKLKALKVIENQYQDIVEREMPLHDGLIINREDEDHQWVIEAYLDAQYWDYFENLKEKNSDIMIQVKITTQTNAPVIFITSIIGMNEISDQMNVLFQGIIIDQQKNEIEGILKSLIEKGFQGEQLLGEFKALMKKH